VVQNEAYNQSVTDAHMHFYGGVVSVAMQEDDTSDNRQREKMLVPHLPISVELTEIAIGI